MKNDTPICFGTGVPSSGSLLEERNNFIRRLSENESPVSQHVGVTYL